MSESICSEETKLNNDSSPKFVKRKVALLLGYLGAGFHGMQLQKDHDLPTIEAQLIEAFTKSGAVREENSVDSRKFGFQRCSRTDKGVSAICQVVSLKMNMINDPVKSINAHLPSQIRVFDMRRTVKSFNCKTRCDSREYYYIIPTFIFAQTIEETQKSYRMTEYHREFVGNLFKNYVGTHKFHNFTSRKSSSDPSVRRYIKEISISKCFERSEFEMMRIHIVGQSFMLHQIRKMIAHVAMICKGYHKSEDFGSVFSESQMHIPLAPGHPLILAKINFDGYNRTYGRKEDRETLDWSNTESERAEFFEQILIPNIIENEEKGNTLDWIKKVHEIQQDSSSSNGILKTEGDEDEEIEEDDYDDDHDDDDKQEDFVENKRKKTS